MFWYMLAMGALNQITDMRRACGLSTSMSDRMTPNQIVRRLAIQGAGYSLSLNARGSLLKWICSIFVSTHRGKHYEGQKILHETMRASFLFLAIVRAPVCATQSEWAETEATFITVEDLGKDGYAFTIEYQAPESTAVNAEGKHIRGPIQKHEILEKNNQLCFKR
ncbi:hypothetical protein FGO68_gene11727 [Halteria grandinella]|uniref:Uncharacterized protein n=1 Tax=Halteria grandinella TaxID=5974 RepID=A0A8J8NAZ5_HALGN|nr:hypothetical protein FGO68_gene11727 [Halteria grandinella]